ncbi:hypothetical protein BURPS1106B_3186 [Burkholderia pseudomallei 1106b]|nr:hypothetical protein BPC006_II1979 [Burkholderia pseudomallei BPC006]AUL60889.1 hypothetical protein BHT10_35880 [Burkholderia pseudomallei]EDS83361.1 hypothetical protein BURPSS13_X0165 [Burkholderia pseudomallei S13]EES20748.1 hypothetical protein BURPS1106B_3186 [Burkholderia pseudomallei 1106b]
MSGRGGRRGCRRSRAPARGGVARAFARAFARAGRAWAGRRAKAGAPTQARHGTQKGRRSGSGR